MSTLAGGAGPAADLPAEEAAALLHLLRDAAREDGIAVVVFTRDERVAAAADRVARLDRGRLDAGAPVGAPLAEAA